MIRKLFIPLLLLFALAACATPQEIEQRRIAQEQADIATCKSYGLRPGSEMFGNCRLQLDLARQQQNYYDRAYFRSGVGFGSYGPRYGSGVGYYF